MPSEIAVVKPCRVVKFEPLVLTENTVPLPASPPRFADPESVLPDRINPAQGIEPSLPLVKLYRVVKLEPLVFRAKTVPKPERPPAYAVPYRALPDKIKPPKGCDPSLPLVKLYRVVKSEPLVLMANTVPKPDCSVGMKPLLVVPYRVSPDKISPA